MRWMWAARVAAPPMFEAITSTGLAIPAALAKDEFGSNLARDKRYRYDHEQYAGRGVVKAAPVVG